MNHFKSINIPYFSEENERSARSIFEESTKIDKPTFEIMKYPKNPHIYKTDAMHPLIYSWLVALEEGHKIVIRPEHIFLLVLNGIGSHFEYTKSPKKQSIRIDWNSPFIDGGYLNNCNVIISDFWEQMTNSHEMDKDIKFALSNAIFQKSSLPQYNNTLHITYDFNELSKDNFNIVGKKKDWIQIHSKINQLLDNIGANYWKTQINELIGYFYIDNPDQEDFFCNLIKYKKSTSIVGGNIIKFFPYIYNNNNKLIKRCSKYFVKTKHLPNSLTKRNIFINDSLGKIYKMSLHSGFLGVLLNIDGSVEPEIWWGIIDENPNHHSDHHSDDDSDDHSDYDSDDHSDDDSDDHSDDDSDDHSEDESDDHSDDDSDDDLHNISTHRNPVVIFYAYILIFYLFVLTFFNIFLIIEHFY